MNYALKLKKIILVDVKYKLTNFILWFNNGLSNGWVGIPASKPAPEIVMCLWEAAWAGLCQSQRTGPFPWTSNTTVNGLATSLVLIIICILMKERYHLTQEEGKTHIKRYNLI